ncbi:hypothetical protein GVAV_001405 [Gurleya vavrai]
MKKELCIFHKATPKTQLEDNIHKYFAKSDSEKDFKRIKSICKIKDIIYCDMTIIFYLKSVAENLVKGFLILIDEARDRNGLEKIIAAFYYNYNAFELQKNNNDFIKITKMFQNLKKYFLDFVDGNRLEFVKQHLLSIDSYSRKNIYYNIDHKSYRNLSFNEFICVCIHNLKFEHPAEGKIKLFTCILNRTNENFSKWNKDIEESNTSNTNLNEDVSDANKHMSELSKKYLLGEVNDIQKSKQFFHIKLIDEISIDINKSKNDNHKSLSLELNAIYSTNDEAFLKKFLEENSSIYMKSNCSDFCVVIENENKTKEILFYIPCFENLINFTNLPLFEIKKDFIDYVNTELNKLSSGTNEAKKELFSIYNFFFKQANYAEIYQVLISPDYFFDLAFSHLKFKLFDFCTDYNKNKDIKEQDFLAKFRVDQFDILRCAAGNCYNFYDFCMVSLLDHDTCNFLYQSTNEYISLIKIKKREFLGRKFQNNQGYLITYYKNLSHFLNF